MIGGYAGKLLFVDLTKGTMTEESVSEDLAYKYVGGYGIGAKILYERMPAGTDPLGPESMLGFMTGPSNGTKAFFGGRYTVVHKSPVTGGWNDANSGGYFGPELKKAGYDGVFFSGISEKPVYLYINDGKAELRDAAHLWGKDAKETWELLKEETGEPRLRISAIGPSGEKVGLISCPINDGHRAPGRGGTGAVMGSKKLKAIAVRGTGNVPVADPEKITAINKRFAEGMKGNPGAQGFGTYGTGVGTGASALNGDSPVKNWGGVGIVDFGEESAEKVAATTFDAKYKTKKYACSTCPLGCGAEYEVNDGRWPLGPTERPEYETAAAFGSTLLCDEMDVIFKCNEICNRYGMDTISAGMTVAWAMECYNNGILSKEELDGIDLTWGNGEAIVALTQKMADGEGVGAVLLNGSAFAAKHFGKGEEYLQTASGIELPMHDPRLAPGFARTYQYDPTPGRHVKGGLGLAQMNNAPIGDKYDYSDTGFLDTRMTSSTEITNSGGFCLFMSVAGDPATQNEYLEAIFGKPFGPEIADETGLRILNLRQAFNIREGILRKDMSIPSRSVGKPPLTAGPLEGVTVDNERLGENFFEHVGWDKETGKPSKEVLEQLGLDFVAEDLYK
ncbi:aldehyde ferredoxin oxidoreductase family protein [Alkalibacter rhizosphaerae]|uniref:Aldehyde ferredoxin oxidoreductase family protein n=1 Tax=Alkalibacter rhizosphaerae TaxID=2815577 RepID=A0A974XFW8_9FIRM|nr:aldehyde ferredoxin oxidoreductase family protein [Alkalibacter rhizosphaerae]QSX09117.1 aldehyde ferredoxin oxidoreductase family protein [Alkalibacter rhizosphaerae]